MGNIISYVNEYGDYSFLERPFKEIDSLVLAVLSYLKYDTLLNECGILERMTLNQRIYKKGVNKEDTDQLFLGLIDVPSYRALLLAVANSKRFGKTEIKYYVNQLDEENESQFAAIVFFPEHVIPYIAFRGTDETLIGWKEDFNMTFLSPVPAQEKALKYLKRISRKIEGDFYVGGHSKGGNLAVFASAMVKPEIQERIEKIYSLEGPGFKESIFEDDNFIRISNKIVKIIPKSSIIGMLLEHQKNYKVVKSSKNGLLQHDPFTWIVIKDDFYYLDNIDRKAMIMNQALYKWIQGMEDEKRMQLVNTIFDVLSSMEMESVLEMSDSWKLMVKRILEATKELDMETKKFLRKTIVQLLRMGAKCLIGSGGFESSKSSSRKFNKN